MPDENKDQKPRLGDRKDLRIEVTASAVASYRQTYAIAFASANEHARRRRTITDAEAAEELAEVLPLASVTFSAGERMTVRARVLRLEVEVQADCTRLAPDHIRCHLATVRRLDTRIERNGSRERGDNVSVRDVYSVAPRRKIGVLRITAAGVAEYRMMAEDNGAPAPPWGPVPEHVRVIATKDDGLAAWLRKHGVK